jgi:hypothetical protein
MAQKLTKKDFVEDIIKHCKTMCFCKTTREDDENLKRLIVYDLQQIGKLENDKQIAVWDKKVAK